MEQLRKSVKEKNVRIRILLMNSSIKRIFNENSSKKEEAIDFLLAEATNKNNPIAQYLLGIVYLRYYDGKSQLADKWLKLSSEQGDPLGMNQFAHDSCKYGEISDETKHLFLASGQAGFTLAYAHLAQRYVISNNMDEAKKYFQMGASLGDETCQYELGLLLERDGEIKLANAYFIMASIGGYFPAFQKLEERGHWKTRKEKCQFIMDVVNGLKIRPSIYFDRRFECELAIFYLKGEVVEQNYPLAYRYLLPDDRNQSAQHKELFYKLEKKFDLPIIELSLQYEESEEENEDVLFSKASSMVEEYAPKEKIAEFLHAGLSYERLLKLEVHKDFLKRKHDELIGIKKFIAGGMGEYFPSAVCLLVGSYLPWFTKV